jgi:LEA14-like dessication related protein
MTEPATNETLRLKLTMAISFFRGWWRTEIACPKQTASGVRDGNLS